MLRFPVQLEQIYWADLWPGRMRAAPLLLERLGIEDGEVVTVRFGLRSAPARFEASQGLSPERLLVTQTLAGALSLVLGEPLTVWRTGPGDVSLGPLVGLMVSDSERSAPSDQRDFIHCRYAAVAREAGALLVFFPPSAAAAGETIAGFVHECADYGPCQWRPIRVPYPAVIYDRAFGIQVRKAAVRVRSVCEGRGTIVLNTPPKISKLMTFTALQPYPELAAHLPFTEPLSAASLVSAMAQFDDLYLKPDALSKGKGVRRLTRSGEGWVLSTRGETGNLTVGLSDEAAVLSALSPMIMSDAGYLVQEGLPLARYLGNRFDFRSLVQKNAEGRWCVTGLVARIAPQGSVLTSPRSGGQTAPAAQALENAFGERSPAVLAEVHRVSLAIAERIEAHVGLCTELGLDLGALEDGSVKLIEVNGIPLRVSLNRLCDPLIDAQINRYPIHFAATLASDGTSLHRESAPEQQPPGLGIMLGPDAMRLLSQNPRYRHMISVAETAGLAPHFFTVDDVHPERRTVSGWALRDGRWVQTEAPLPEVIYNRATYPRQSLRTEAKEILHWLTRAREVSLLNGVNNFSKLTVYEALQFFPDTASLAPETTRYHSAANLRSMLLRHGCVFAKANHGSHGSDVVRITRVGETWEVDGRIGGEQVSRRFANMQGVEAFLSPHTHRREWVLQQGIALPEIEGRIFDFRVIAQKDGEGRWAVPLLVVRWGKSGNVAANTSQGGEAFLFDQFLERFGAAFAVRPDLREAASQAAVLTAMALESRVGRLGEVGVDIGVDRRGALWVFEANSKPRHPHLPGLAEDHLLRLPLQYAAYLADQARAGRQSGLLIPVDPIH